MNTKLLHRLAWKELRSLRALWLSLLGMALVVQMCSAMIDNRHGDRVAVLFGAALWLPVVFSLACAAMAFAGEREEGTDQLLCRLAGPPLALWIVKFAMIVLCTVVMFVIVYPVAWIGSGVDERVWAHNPNVIPEMSGFRQADSMVGQMHGLAIFWGVCLLSWGMFFSLLLRRVLPCLIVSVLATLVTQWMVVWLVSLFPNQQRGLCTAECLLQLGLLPGLVPLLASVWLVQTWDEERWPRLIEWSIGFARRLSRLRLRVTGTDGGAISLIPEPLRTEVGSRAGIAGVVRAMLRRIGFCGPDEWLPSWRREVRRLLWLELRSAWWVSLGLVAAGSLSLFAVIVTAHSRTDMELVLGTLPLTMSFVAFALGVWSFHGQQREQRFRFFAAQGASPTAMWLVKHVVWLSFAALAVSFLLSFTAMISDVGFHDDVFNSHRIGNAIQSAFFQSGLGGSEWNRSHWAFRLLFGAAQATHSMPTEVYQYDRVVGVWPMVSLLLLSMGRGFVMVWLSFAVGQLASLLIPRAVTSMLVGVLAMGVAVGWWMVISIWQVPLLIGVCPVLLGLLATSWGRMSDWLEERSGWRRWLRLATTMLVPMLLALVGMATYRVYEVPLVELPWEPPGPASVEAQQTGEDWARLAMRLEDPFDRRGAVGMSLDGVHVRATEPSPALRQQVDKDVIPVFDADLYRIKDANWRGFVERDWLTSNAANLNEAMQLANRPDCSMPKSWDPSNDLRRDQFGRVALLLKMSAFESLANHRLDESLQRGLALYRYGQHLGRYRGSRDRWRLGVDVQVAALHVLREWALSPDQTEASLLAALGRSENGPHPIAQLVRAEGSFAVDPFEVLRFEYAESQANHDELWRNEPTPHRWMPSPYRIFRWEKSRGERLLKVLVLEADTNLRRGLTRYASWDPRRVDFPYDRLLKNAETDHLANPWDSPSRGERWAQTTEVRLGNGWDQQALSHGLFPALAELETHRRGLWLMLALQAHRLKHDRLPDRLEELVGPYLDRLPSDPTSGLAFEYRPQGFPLTLGSDGAFVAPNTPLLLSPGSMAARSEPVTAEYWDRLQSYWDRASNRDRSAEAEVPSINGLRWVSVFASGIRYGQAITEPFAYSGAKFSLRPSF